MVRTSSAQNILIMKSTERTADFILIPFLIILHGRSEAHGIFSVSLSPFTFPHLFLKRLFNMVSAVMQVSALKKYTSK